MLDREHVADCREKVDVSHDGVVNCTAGEAAGTAHDQREYNAMIGEIAFHGGEGDAVVGGGNHQRVFGEAARFERLQDQADAFIHDARGGFEGGDVFAGLWRIGN